MKLPTLNLSVLGKWVMTAATFLAMKGPEIVTLAGGPQSAPWVHYLSLAIGIAGLLTVQQTNPQPKVPS